MRKIFSFIAAVLFAGSMMAETYTKTAYADLQSGDVVIITMQKDADVFAASNDQGTSKAPVATAVTVADDAITTDAENILWTVVKDGDNISFQTGEAFLYCTNSNNGMRVGSNSNNVFSINAESGYLFNNATSRYIGVYNNADWRCYTSVNSNIKDQTLAFFAIGGVPVEANEVFYLTGSFRGWEQTADAAYKFTATATEGEYSLEVAFEETVEVKAIGLKEGEDTKWYPDGMGNNLNLEAGEYTIRLRPAGDGGEGWHEGVLLAEKKEAPVVHQYEVAEAIKAGLEENTEILVRGIITKMEIKGKNFARYGSVNIYVADVNGAEGEFEFYNCYSLNADTFKTTSPEYEATSTDLIEIEEAADANGNAIHVGDTVIAFGKYKLYNTTHELNTGCYLTEIKHVAEAPVEEEWTEIVFNEAVAAADLPADASFEFDGLHVAITDSENKMSIDGNKAYFGTADVYTQYAFRLKTGGKSLNGQKQNFITINVPEDGELRLAVRSGNSSDETRTLILAQGNDTIYNAIVKDADAIEVKVTDSTTAKVFPYVKVPVKAGNINVSYPVNGLNFYSFAFHANLVPPTPEDTYTVAGAPEAIFGSYWNPADANNDMVLADGIYTWEKTGLELTAGTKIEFKVVKNHSWDNAAYPASNYEVIIAEDGEYTLTITFDPVAEAVAAEAVKKEALPDPTNCAEAAEAALSVSANNELYNDGKVYTIEGYVTGIKEAWSSQYKNISFWMADVADGGEVLQAFRAVCENEADAPKVGDKVAVTGQLTKHYSTPEFAAGCTFVILEATAVENAEAEVKAIKRIENGVLVIEKAGVRYNAFGQIMQ